MELSMTQVDLVIHVLSFAINTVLGWDPISVANMAALPGGYVETPGETLARHAEDGDLSTLELASGWLSALIRIAEQIKDVSTWPATIELDETALVALLDAIGCYSGWLRYEERKGWVRGYVDSRLVELAVEKHGLSKEITLREITKEYDARLNKIQEIVVA